MIGETSSGLLVDAGDVIAIVGSRPQAVWAFLEQSVQLESIWSSGGVPTNDLRVCKSLIDVNRVTVCGLFG